MNFKKKHDKIKCGIMDESTNSHNINRLAVINFKNNNHNNIYMIRYFKKDIIDYKNKYNIIF